MGKNKSKLTSSLPNNSNNSSPRPLMSFLQHTHYGGDVAIMEILRDRQAAITTGKLKGRRLFPEDCGDLGEEEKVEEKGVVVVVAEKAAKVAVRLGGGWLLVAGAGWVVGVVLLFVIVFGVGLMRCNGKYVFAEEMMSLVPT